MISVIIPSYNVTHLIDWAIRSVLGQWDVEDFEIIVVDDCLTANAKWVKRGIRMAMIY